VSRFDSAGSAPPLHRIKQQFRNQIGDGSKVKPRRDLGRSRASGIIPPACEHGGQAVVRSKRRKPYRATQSLPAAAHRHAHGARQKRIFGDGLGNANWIEEFELEQFLKPFSFSRVRDRDTLTAPEIASRPHVERLRHRLLTCAERQAYDQR
jgi:hypothetical protein